MKKIKKSLNNHSFLFFLGFLIILFVFSIYPAVKLARTQADITEPTDCYGNYEKEGCIDKLHAWCLKEKGVSDEKKKEFEHVVIPRCDQTPDLTKTIPYEVEKSEAGKEKETETKTEPKSEQFDEYCYPVRACGLDDFVQLFVNLAKWGWWILPSLALLMFIWGGFLLLTSGGNQERIQQGKRMLLSVLIGGIVVLILVWILTSFVIYALTGNKEGSIFGKPWYGGTTVGPTTGCCITEFECKDSAMTRDECLVQPFYIDWQARVSCFQEKNNPVYTICMNKKKAGCCVPKDINNKECILPNSNAVKPEDKCAATYNYDDKNNCYQISQCITLPDVRQPGNTNVTCCKPEDPINNDCIEQEAPVCAIGPPYNYTSISGPCSAVSDCLGCCYNSTATSCTNNSLRSSCPNPTQYWKQKQVCTPYQCGKTCCSPRCGKGKPNVDKAQCNDILESPAPGECTGAQLTGNAICLDLAICTRGMNLQFCQAYGLQNCVPDSFNDYCYNFINTVCPDPNSNGNREEHITDC